MQRDSRPLQQLNSSSFRPRASSMVPSGLIATKESDLDSHRLSNVRRSTMRSGITFDVTAADRARLEAIVANRGSPQKHAWRAKIILMSDDGLGTVAIMATTGNRRPASGDGRSGSWPKV